MQYSNFRSLIYIFSVIIVLTSGISNTIKAQDDLSVRLNESQLNNALNAAIDARGINYGQYNGQFGLDAWFVNVKSATADIKPNEEIEIDFEIDVTAEIDLYLITFGVHVESNGTMEGEMEVKGNPANGFRSVFKGDVVDISLPPVIEWLLSYTIFGKPLLIALLPDIELNVGVSLLPDFIETYFTSSMPNFYTTENELVFSFTIEGPRQITVQNDFDGHNNVEDIEALVSGEWIHYASPHPFWWDLGSSHQVQAISTIPTYDNREWKFHHWHETGETTNQISIEVTRDWTYTAKFGEVQPLTLQTDLGGITSGGSIIYEGQQYSSPFNDYGFEQPYSTNIGALPELNVNDILWYFQRWQDGVTSPNRSISLTQPTTYTAEYKGHLASNTTNALTFNNQRKIVWDDTYDKYHMVYEDGGEIYYTSSTGPDNAWVPEVLLSDGVGWNKYPSIDVDGDGIVVVVWQRDFGGHGDIQMRRKITSGWQDPQTVIYFPTPSGFKATPVLSAYPAGYYFIVWHSYGHFNNLSIILYDKSSGTFGTETIIDQTNSNSLYPSLAADTYGRLHLAWSESDKIYYTRIIYSHGSYHFAPDKEEASYGTGYFSHHIYPSITTDCNHHANITWQAFNGPLLAQSILHRRREPGGWGSATAFDPDESKEYYKPNITGFPNMNAELRIAWRRSDNKIWVAVYNGASWDDFSQPVNGFDPSLSANMSNNNEVVKMVYRGTSSNPYILTTTSDGLIYSPQFLKPTSAKAVHRRCGVLTLGKSSIAFELGEFQIDGNPVELFPYSDTLIVGNTGKWDEMFRTESFQISGQSSLSYFRGFTVEKRDTLKNILPKGVKIKLNLEVVNAQSGQVISIPDIQTITSNVPPNSREFKDVLFNLSGTQEVFLRVGLNLPKGIAMKQSMVEVYCIGDSAANFQKPLSEETTVPIINKPVHFKLGNNYPNPFNPTTTIAFDLAHDSFVELEIYDTSGRKVKTMVSKNMEAGSYHAIWDGYDEFGNQVASGVYFYRIQASEFAAVNKMMLLR